jgi:hypothetical protein
MSDTLFAVESTFRIEGRGLALIGITAEQYSSVKVGDTLAVQKPDGSVVMLNVLAVEYPPSMIWVGDPSSDPRYGVVVEALDVPVGSIVTLAQPCPPAPFPPLVLADLFLDQPKLCTAIFGKLCGASSVAQKC